MEAYGMIDSLRAGGNSDFDVAAWRQSCYDAMNDDFNSPILIAQLFEAAKWINALKNGSEQATTSDIDLLKTTFRGFVFDVLGLLELANEGSGSDDKLGSAVELLIELRNQARANKDFATSDQIRDELQKVGIQLKDGKEGTTYSLN